MVLLLTLAVYCGTTVYVAAKATLLIQSLFWHGHTAAVLAQGVNAGAYTASDITPCAKTAVWPHSS